jgi:glycosyltransferase involved in cell wall biosynthesis
MITSFSETTLAFKDMMTSVVVPAYNAGKVIAPCIEALLKQDYPKDRYEIIFVDNASTDDTASVIQRYPVTYVYEARKGANAARNKGIMASSGDVIAFTDADCIPVQGWLRHLIEGFSDESVNIAAGTLVPLNPYCSIISTFSLKTGQYNSNVKLNHPKFPYAQLGNVAIRKSVFESAGLCDPLVRGYDAAELFYRIKKEGLLNFKIEQRAVVFFRTRDTLIQFVRQNFIYGRGYARFFYMHPNEVDLKSVEFTGVIEAFLRSISWGLKTFSRSRDVTFVMKMKLLGLYLIREVSYAVGSMSFRVSSLSKQESSAGEGR